MGKTLFQKIFDKHIIQMSDGSQRVLVDLHIMHEVTSPQAFEKLRQKGIKVKYPHLHIAVPDHNTPTTGGMSAADVMSKIQVQTLEKNCREFGITFIEPFSEEHGVIHIIGPELGLTRPGITICAGDSHTSTHGAFGAVAWGIGTSQVRDILATQTYKLPSYPKQMRITINGTLQRGVTAKDVILHIISQIGTSAGTGFAVEYAGSFVENASMDERTTLCNMTIEFNGRFGIIKPDDTTIKWYTDTERKYLPSSEITDELISEWKSYYSDDDAKFDVEHTFKAEDITPMVTWGTTPGMGSGIDEVIPKPDSVAHLEKVTHKDSLKYMGLKPGQKVTEIPVDFGFIGSCTNGRISDLREAVNVITILKKQGINHLKKGINGIVVPGSYLIKKEAEKEGLDKVFTDFGFEWRDEGCSMCLGMNPDQVPANKYCASSSNRNFKNRQGKGARTLLMSPEMVVLACALGHPGDIRQYMEGK
ncbi:3-isopropylmalate dehydratase large subunit [Candidatus Margulisiibacteriota bacterium]